MWAKFIFKERRAEARRHLCRLPHASALGPSGPLPRRCVVALARAAGTEPCPADSGRPPRSGLPQWDSVSPSAGRAPGSPRAPRPRPHPQRVGLGHGGVGGGSGEESGPCSQPWPVSLLGGPAFWKFLSLQAPRGLQLPPWAWPQPCVLTCLAAEHFAGQSVTGEQRAPGTPATSGPCPGPQARKGSLCRGELRAGLWQQAMTDPTRYRQTRSGPSAGQGRRAEQTRRLRRRGHSPSW